jgi:hypothetical protein
MLELARKQDRELGLWFELSPEPEKLAEAAADHDAEADRQIHPNGCFAGEHPTWLAPSVEGKELFIGRRLWCNGVWRSRRRKPRPTDQWCFEKPVGEHGSFGFALRALVRPGSDP